MAAPHQRPPKLSPQSQAPAAGLDPPAHEPLAQACGHRGDEVGLGQLGDVIAGHDGHAKPMAESVCGLARKPDRARAHFFATWLPRLDGFRRSQRVLGGSQR